VKTIEVIVLVGGAGTRLGVITQRTQKCLLVIDGKPTLAHIMDSLVDAFGSVDLKIGVAHRAEDVKYFVDHNKPNKVSVTYVPHILGTEGWGIYRDMKPYIHGPFVALPGDVIALPHAYSGVLQQFLRGGVDGAMTLSPHLDVVDTHGVGFILNDRVIDLRWPAPEIIYPGYLRDMTIWASDVRWFDVIEKYPNPKKSIGYVFMDAIRDNKPIAGNYYDSPWVHVGYPEDLSKPSPKA